jgi:hypothetical protein
MDQKRIEKKNGFCLLNKTKLHASLNMPFAYTVFGDPEEPGTTTISDEI